MLLYKSMQYALHLFLTFLIVHYSSYIPRYDSTCLDLISPSLENEKHLPWWPTGCSLRNYTTLDVQNCLENKLLDNKNTTIALLGDSHERQMMTDFIQMVDSKDVKHPKSTQAAVEFVPEKNIEIIYRALYIFTDNYKKLFKEWEKKNVHPDLVIIGCTLHPILDFHASNEALHEFRLNITRHLPLIDKLTRKGTVLWYVQPPVKYKRDVLTDDQVTIYINMIKKVIKGSRFHTWTTPRLLAKTDLTLYRDGIHIGYSTSRKLLMLLFNFHCNSRLHLPSEFCCSKSDKQNFSYMNLYSFLAVIGMLTLVVISELQKSSRNFETPHLLFVTNVNFFDQEAHNKWTVYFWTVFLNVIKCSVYVGFIYLCDRTPIFEKEERGNSFPYFSFISLLICFICYKKEFPETANKKIVLISEIKGLIIVTLIFVKLTELSRFLPIESITRVLESSLLFLTGIEYFSEFWENESSDFIFYVKKMTSTNFLFLFLLATLHQNYQFYELLLLLLTSFHIWFIVSIFPVFMDKSLTWKSFLSFGCKILIVFIIIYLINDPKDMKFFTNYYLKLIFATKDGTMNLWLQRWKIDKFSFTLGILSVFFATFHPLLQQSFNSCFKSKKLRYLGFIVLFIALFAILVVMHHFTSIFFLIDLKNWYSNITVLQILCYIVLCIFILKYRLIYWPILSLLGGLWLEIYLLHFHTFTAYNGTALLQLISSSFYLNEILIFIITVYLAYEFHTVTKHINNIFY